MRLQKITKKGNKKVKIISKGYNRKQIDKFNKLKSIKLKSPIVMSLSQHVLSSHGQKDVDIVLKYKKYPQFKKQLDKIQISYQEVLNMSLYSNLQNYQKCGMFQLVDSKDLHSKVKFYLNVYGFRMNEPYDEEDNLFLLFIRMLDQKLRENSSSKYSIVYYHCLSESTSPFSFLKEAFKKLPLFCYAMLDKIYVVEPNFLVKNTVGILDFGRLHKLFSKRIHYIDNLYELGKIQQIHKSKVLDQLPKQLKEQKAKKDEKKANKNGALQDIENKVQNKQEKPINTNELKATKKQDFLTIPLQNHKLTSQGLPIPLLIILQTIKSRPQFLNMQGIFRKSGSIEQEQDIIVQLSKMTSVMPLKNIDEYSGYAIAGVAKKFFTKLTVPIISYEIYNEIMQTHDIQQGKESEFVRSMMLKLPPLNKRVLIHLILFLKQQVISRKDLNKMNNYNMSVCFCPCIFRAKQATLEDLMNSGRFAKILYILITRFEDIFPKQELKLFIGKQNRGSKGSKGSRGSRNSKENSKQNKDDSPTKILI